MFGRLVLTDTASGHEIFERIAVFCGEVAMRSFVVATLVSSLFFVRHGDCLEFGSEMQFEFDTNIPANGILILNWEIQTDADLAIGGGSGR